MCKRRIFFLPPKIMLFIKCNSGVIREDFRDLCQSLKLCNPYILLSLKLVASRTEVNLKFVTDPERNQKEEVIRSKSK